jgi:hypothetical protein
MILEDRPPNSLILLAKNYSQIKLENYWLPRYLKSDVYREIESLSKTRMPDVVSDVIYLKNKKTPTTPSTLPAQTAQLQAAVSSSTTSILVALSF